MVVDSSPGRGVHETGSVQYSRRRAAKKEERELRNKEKANRAQSLRTGLAPAVRQDTKDR